MIDTGGCPNTCFSGVHLCHDRDLTTLLDLAREGDEQAFSVLVEAYEPGLRKTANQVLGQGIQSEVDTEDLIQSVHWSLWVGLRAGKFDVNSGDRLLAVARAILRRRVARVWETLERRRRLASNIAGDVRSRNGLADEGEPAHQISAEDQFEHLCKILTSTERRLIELRILGHTTAEAAREMGQDPENLRVTLARLRKKLRDSGIFPDSRHAR
jgi:RNA polymerase sigma factor (sigma-70 family)